MSSFLAQFECKKFDVCLFLLMLFLGFFFGFIDFQVLGVSPIEGFDSIKVKYARKRKEAERQGDEATAARVRSLLVFISVLLACLWNWVLRV